MMEILLWVRIKLLNILLSQAHDGENEVGDKAVKMRLQVGPYLLWFDTLIQEDECVGETWPAEPGGLGHPLLNLL